MNEELAKLIKFVNATADLAEAVERDIKNGSKISNDTVLKLSTLVVATRNVANLIDLVDERGVKLQ